MLLQYLTFGMCLEVFGNEFTKHPALYKKKYINIYWCEKFIICFSQLRFLLVFFFSSIINYS